MKISAIAFCLAVILSGAQASAHAVYVFAWQEGGNICTDSYFSKKSKVRGGTVHMQDNDRNTLQTGTTGQDGICCFPIPIVEGDLIFVVEAGEGHRGEFTLPAEQIIASDMPARSENMPEFDEAQLRQIIREELQKELAPIQRASAEKNDQTPTLREIIGGLGWIVGIFSLLFWLLQRKKEKNN